MKAIKFLTRIVVVLLCGIIFTDSALATKKSQGQSLDRIIVIVNDTPIMQSELDNAIDTLKQQSMGSNTPLPPDSVLRKKMLDQLIDRKLQLLVADQSGMHISDAQVNQAIDTIAKQNNISSAELLQKVAAEGITASDYRKEIREELILQQLQQQEVGAKITISPDEVKSLSHAKQPQTGGEKEYHLEDFLITLPDNPSAADLDNAKKVADALLIQLRQGVTQNNNSVDLGWRKASEIPTEFSSQAVSMKKDAFAGPIQTANGLHIIRLLDVRTANAAATAQTNDVSPQKEAEQMLYQQKFEKALKTWLAKLRSEAVINMHPDN